MSNKKRLLIIAAVIVIGALIYFYGFNRSTGIEVNSMEVSSGALQQSLEITGKVLSEDVQEIAVPEGTKVLEVMVQEGEEVKKGDVLAVLDSSELKTRLEKLRINLEQVEADLRTAGESADRKILQNNLQKAQESLSTVQRDYETTKDKLEDMRILYENGAISNAELVNQENALKSLESSVSTAALNVEDARLRYSELGSTTSSTTGSLERQKRSILLDIQQLEDQIQDTRLIAELDGKVVSSELKSDRTTTAVSRLILQDTESFKFEALVTQEDAVSIMLGQVAIIQVNGLSGEYKGQVAKIGSKAEEDPESGSSTPKVRITINLADVDGRLVSGYDADAAIVTGSVENVVLVKNEAIRSDGEESFLFLIEDGKAARKSIQTGITDRYQTEVTDGLEPGEIIVINPPEDIQDGTDVDVVE